VLFGRFGEFEEFFFGAPFGTFGALLVEFTEVVEIVDIVANALGISGFATRRQPDVADTNSLEFGDLLGQAFPVLMVVWDVPFEALKEGFVFGRGFLF